MGTSSKTKAPVAGAHIKIGYGPMVTLLMFSTAMLVMPLATYFYVRRYIVDSTTFGAMGAIVVVQIIVALYIYKAWTDENKEFRANTAAQVKAKKKA